MTTEVAKTVARLRDTFDSGHTRPAGWRKAQLRRLGQLLSEGEGEIAAAESHTPVLIGVRDRDARRQMHLGVGGRARVNA